MGKVFTRFQTKTAQKPYPMGRHIAIWLIYGSTPRVFVITSDMGSCLWKDTNWHPPRPYSTCHWPGSRITAIALIDFRTSRILAVITSLHVSGVHWGECGVTSRCFFCTHLLAASSKHATRWQTIPPRFFVHFFAVTARLRHEDVYFHVLWRTWTQDHSFLFLILNFRISLLEFNSTKNCQYLTNWTRWKRDYV